jgi:hypothetical protein
MNDTLTLSSFSLTWLKDNIDFPALVFVALLILGVWVLKKAQDDPHNGFDVKQMLLDDNGKPSSFRLGTLVSMAASTWALMYHVLSTQGKLDIWVFLGYTLIWSGSTVASKLVDAYAASKGVSYPPSTPVSKPLPKSPPQDPDLSSPDEPAAR